ncbi:MAG TPA: response regulator [Spirochaetota bacterium]|nr:response regulator [Spirochaetota bacterium]
MTALEKRILVVEDSAHDIEMISRAFDLAGIVACVDTVRSGPEALDYLYGRNAYEETGAGRPVLVLLDIKLPFRSGIEVVRELKEDENMKTIPVIMLTSSDDAGDIEAAYRAGANAYIIKPTSFSEFVAIIRSMTQFWLTVNEHAK